MRLLLLQKTSLRNVVRNCMAERLQSLFPTEDSLTVSSPRVPLNPQNPDLQKSLIFLENRFSSSLDNTSASVVCVRSDSGVTATIIFRFLWPRRAGVRVRVYLLHHFRGERQVQAGEAEDYQR